MNELKTCPFCGSEAHIKEVVSSCERLYTVGCSDSGCMGFETLLLKPTKEEAATAWNHRAELTWHDFSDELPPAGKNVLCKGKNGAIYVGKPVTFKGKATRSVWVPRGDQYRSPKKWMVVDDDNR